MQPLAYSCHGTRLEGGKSNINTNNSTTENQENTEQYICGSLIK